MIVSGAAKGAIEACILRAPFSSPSGRTPFMCGTIMSPHLTRFLGHDLYPGCPVVSSASPSHYHTRGWAQRKRPVGYWTNAGSTFAPDAIVPVGYARRWQQTFMINPSTARKIRMSATTYPDPLCLSVFFVFFKSTSVATPPSRPRTAVSEGKQKKTPT